MTEFTKWARDQEVLLRGFYLTITVDAEWMLIMIIDQSFKGNHAEIKQVLKKPLHELDLFEKILVCKKGLRKYHKDFYRDHKDDIGKLDKLRGFRNKFAHRKIDPNFMTKSRKTLLFYDLKNRGKIVGEEYELTFLKTELENYGKTIKSILSLIAKFLENNSSRQLLLPSIPK